MHMLYDLCYVDVFKPHAGDDNDLAEEEMLYVEVDNKDDLANKALSNPLGQSATEGNRHLVEPALPRQHLSSLLLQLLNLDLQVVSEALDAIKSKPDDVQTVFEGQFGLKGLVVRIPHPSDKKPIRKPLYHWQEGHPDHKDYEEPIVSAFPDDQDAGPQQLELVQISGRWLVVPPACTLRLKDLIHHCGYSPAP